MLDEADRMLDMGFRPVVDRIVAMTPARPPDAALLGDARRRGRPHRARATRATRAATSTPPRRERAATSSTASCAVSHEAKLDRSSPSCATTERGRTLVFVRTKRGADRLVKQLARARRRGRRDARRQVAERSASARSPRSSAGRVDTLVATDVAARGIDVATSRT